MTSTTMSNNNNNNNNNYNTILCYNEEDVQLIISMGFNEDQAREALTLSKGKIDVAINRYLLLSNSFSSLQHYSFSSSSLVQKQQQQQQRDGINADNANDNDDSNENSNDNDNGGILLNDDDEQEDHNIKVLISMGFTKEEADESMRSSGFVIEDAVNLLLRRSSSSSSSSSLTTEQQNIRSSFQRQQYQQQQQQRRRRSSSALMEFSSYRQQQYIQDMLSLPASVMDSYDVLGTIDDDNEEEEEEELLHQYWLSQVDMNPNNLENAPIEGIRDNKRFMLTVVQKHGSCLKYATPDLQNDKEIILAAVTNYGLAIQYVPNEEIRNDIHISMAAIQVDSNALQYTSKEIVLMVVSKCGLALRYVSIDHKNDLDIVVAATQNDIKAIKHVPSHFKTNKRFVIGVISKHPDSLKLFPEEIYRDYDVMIAAGLIDESTHRDDDDDDDDSDHDDDSDDDDHYALPTAVSSSSSSSSSSSWGGGRRSNNSSNNNSNSNNVIRTKITLSTRFSLNPTSSSEATNFTKLLKDHPYIKSNKMMNFKIYAPNAHDKATCDPDWTNFDWPCRGTTETCQFHPSLTTLAPTDDCCWRYSFRHQLMESKKTGGFMLQLIEKDSTSWCGESFATLGNGQRIERDMAKQLNLKMFHIYRPMNAMDSFSYEESFQNQHIDIVVDAIKGWYDNDCRDMSDCIVRP